MGATRAISDVDDGSLILRRVDRVADRFDADDVDKGPEAPLAVDELDAVRDRLGVEPTAQRRLMHPLAELSDSPLESLSGYRAVASSKTATESWTML